MAEYVAEDQMLEEWGGTDGWQYAWVPEGCKGEPASVLILISPVSDCLRQSLLVDSST